MRSLLALAIGTACGYVLARSPLCSDPHLKIGGDADPYMLRWHLTPRNKWLSIYLHKFLHSDYDDALHDHPYDNVSIVLQGGYIEHLGRYPRRVGQIIYRKAEQPHRIELYKDAGGKDKPAWSLFICGPRRRTWGYHCPQGWRPWHVFVDPGKYGVRAKQCGDVP